MHSGQFGGMVPHDAPTVIREFDDFRSRRAIEEKVRKNDAEREELQQVLDDICRLAGDIHRDISDFKFSLSSYTNCNSLTVSVA